MISFATLDECNVMAGLDAQHGEQVKLVSTSVDFFCLVFKKLLWTQRGMLFIQTTTTETMDGSIRWGWCWWWRTALIAVEEITRCVLLMIGLTTLITNQLQKMIVQHNLPIRDDVAIRTLRASVSRSDQDEKRWNWSELGRDLSEWVAKNGGDVDPTKIVRVGIEHLPYASSMKEIECPSHEPKYGSDVSTYRECCWWHWSDLISVVDRVVVFWWVQSERVVRVLEETRWDLFPSLERMDLLLPHWVHREDDTWHHLVTLNVSFRWKVSMKERERERYIRVTKPFGLRSTWTTLSRSRACSGASRSSTFMCSSESKTLL